MNRSLFLLTMLLVVNLSYAQFPSINPSLNPGWVGIGVTVPNSPLHVNSANTGWGTTNWIAGNFGGQSGDRVVMGLLYGVATIGSHNNSLNAWSNLSINTDGGNVGIGTPTPGFKLDVNGSANIGSIAYLGGVKYNLMGQPTTDGTGFIQGYNINLGSKLANSPYSLPTNLNTGPTSGVLYGKGCIWFVANSSQPAGTPVNIAMKIDSTRTVSFNGAVTVGGFLTALGGHNFPDYVFKPTYKLPSLSEVKSYIDKHKHLPAMPSAEEVKQNGLNIGETEKVLVKKIEELTLYLIENEQEKNKLKKALVDQQLQLDQIKKQLDALSKRN